MFAFFIFDCPIVIIFKFSYNKSLLEPFLCSFFLFLDPDPEKFETRIRIQRNLKTGSGSKAGKTPDPTSSETLGIYLKSCAGHGTCPTVILF